MNINIKWLGKQSFEGTNADGQKIMISPDPNETEMISPPDVLLMSLGSCTGLFITPAAKSLNVSIEDFDISVKGFKSDNPPKLFDKIQIKVIFKGDLTKDQAEKVIEKSHEKCFILQSLNPNIEIESIVEVA